MARGKGFARAIWIVLALGFLAAGLSRITFNIDVLKLLPTHLPQVEGLSIFLEHFSQPTEMIVTVSAADAEVAGDAALALAEHLGKRTDLVKRVVAQPPWEKNPADMAELLAMLTLNQPAKVVKALVDRLTPEQASETVRGTLERMDESLSPQEVALLGYDPLGLTAALADSGLMSNGQLSEFSSADGTFRVIYLEAAVPLKNYKHTIKWVGEIKALANTWNSDGKVTLGFTGEPAFVADISGTMEWDMASSANVTLLLIGSIFWLCFRRAKPLVDLIAMLMVIFALSLAAAGLFLRELTIIGVGFASIMIGLSVDYGYFIYQKSLRHTGTLRELQQECFASIAWTAGTTAAAFFALNLSSLPGLSQLGNLVGIGVLVGSAVMLLLFAPLAMRWKKMAFAPDAVERWMADSKFTRTGAWMTLALVVFLGGVLIIKGLPGVDVSPSVLRPRHSQAYETLDQLYAKLTDDTNLLSLVVTGKTGQEVRDKLQATETKLKQAEFRGEVTAFQSPLPLWPDAYHQIANLPVLAVLAGERGRLKQAVLDAGFTEESFLLTDAVFRQWTTWAESGKRPPIWPENEASRWIYRRIASLPSTPDGVFVAGGVVTPAPGRADAVAREIQGDGVWLVSWKAMGSELQRVVPGEFRKLILGLLGVILVLLWIGFRSFRDVLVLSATLALVGIALMGAMRLLGMEWNFFNIAAILLLLGTGVDYSILLLLALRRNGGDVVAARQALGLVILLCAGSAAAGFGTLTWANNRGLASLGETCALGLALDAVISIFLLPVLWRISRGKFQNLK
ncbi:MAG TPA: MMPL family transporter [Chthoniobacterales bacterium]